MLVEVDMKSSTIVVARFLLGSAFGAVIACSPTKFSNNPTNLCTDANETCVVQEGHTSVTQEFKVGAGKVDILFVDDNSASMSTIQSKLAAKFAGFIEALDAKEIDYRIGITTTDIAKSAPGTLETFPSGQKVLTKSDVNRVALFNSAIVRSETSTCEQFIKSAYNTYGPSFNTTAYYANNYNIKCPSNDERGIYSAHSVISNNSESLIRPDAHLNVIVLSNEDVRSGLYQNSLWSSQYALANEDKATNFISMVNNKYPEKYWEFNSIITKDNACISQQQAAFTGSNGQPIKDSSGNFVIGANIGYEYAAISSSASRDVDGNLSPRGQVLNICNNDYTSNFANIAAKIADSARLLSLKCAPTEAPTVSALNGTNVNIPYTWNGGSQIIFQKGSEGIRIKVSYKCYTGVM
jgi:hypothetical protein